MQHRLPLGRVEIGEKIVVRRIGRVEGEKVSSYMHRTNKDLPPQVGVLVATDAKGATQPFQAANWNPQGYGGNPVSRIRVLVES